ncbi:MAG TPA: prepilin-type N-terminal cleavage/methylation domain-containing protein [Candidatus Saccharimonadales bacterium]|nr:prepilin-type N-terminal cleavage/methylation domain-containing protein [Candidatus Saccharimonadales bacterium]
MQRRNFSARNRQQGYTLLELLLYVALIGALLTSVVSYFGIVADSRVKNQTIIEVNDQAIALMDVITQTVRNATAITAPAAGASGSSLTLTVPTGSLSPTVFALSGTTATIKEGAGAAVNLTDSEVQITSLTFTNLTRTGTSGAVQISFTMTRVNPASRNEYDYQKTFTTTAEVAW